MAIEIITRLHDGIYRSSGGGERRVMWRRATGPLNLLRAARLFPSHVEWIETCYGNVGCGRSWVEIDGQWIEGWDMPQTMAEARALLAQVSDGSYARAQAVMQASMDADDQACLESLERGIALADAEVRNDG
jgi:hypothetical protein